MTGASTAIQIGRMARSNATRLAVKKATAENFARMEELLARMDGAAAENDMELHGRLDYLFHLEISRATQNNIFVIAYEVNRKLFCRHATLLNNEYIRIRKKEDVHRRLYRAIRDKDLALCLEYYREMLFFLESPPPILNESRGKRPVTHNR
jgi:DNA-binding FadR family transcriptional regulator